MFVGYLLIRRNMMNVASVTRCLLVLVVFTVGMAQAALVENFESYSDGAFVSQTGGKWSGDADWQVTTLPAGNKVLVRSSGNDDAGLVYTGGEFSAAGTGYTMMMTMLVSGPNSQYSGWLCDTDNIAGHGYRFYPENAYFMDWSNRWNAIEGTYDIPKETATYFRQYRNGNNVEIYISDTPFSAENYGTQILNGTVPALTASGNYLGLYGVKTVYFDDIQFYQGNVVPEPATIGLLTLGGWMLRRRK
jgi:hypothetical protein